LLRNTPLILLVITIENNANGISTDTTRGTMVVVKQLQQLDNHTEIMPVTLIKIEEEICMFTLMMERVEDEFPTIL
jgi:hypothetical protein